MFERSAPIRSIDDVLKMEESAKKTGLADRLIDVWQTAVFWSLLAPYLQRPQPERNSVAENLATERVGAEPTCRKCAGF